MKLFPKVARTADHQFIYHLVNLFGKLPDDIFYENINPYLKVWLYENWFYQQEIEAEKLKNQAIFIGSFSNPEMAQKMLKSEKPDFQTSDLDASSKMVHEEILREEREKGKKKRKKRKVIE